MEQMTMCNLRAVAHVRNIKKNDPSFSISTHFAGFPARNHIMFWFTYISVCLVATDNCFQ